VSSHPWVSKSVESRWFKEAKKFPIGTMVRFLDLMSLKTRYGLVMNYMQIGLVDGEDLQGLSLFVDGAFELYEQPGAYLYHVHT
jgi:hypothetical protein